MFGKKIKELSKKLINSFSSKKKEIEKELKDLTKDPYEDLLTDYTYFNYGNMVGNNMASTGVYGTGSTNGVYNISTSGTVNTGGLVTTSTTGGYTWANSSAATYPTVSISSANVDARGGDITLTRKGKPPLNIGATLDTIIEALYIIVPDEQEHKENPALKSAYEEWQNQFRIQTERMQSLKDAYESYMVMKKLCREEEE